MILVRRLICVQPLQRISAVQLLAMGFGEGHVRQHFILTAIH